MARTKRKVNPLQPEFTAPASFKDTYRAAGYIRLSIEDSNRPGSETLEDQKRVVEAYIKNDPTLTLAGLFCDNGRTGTDFDRPEFDRLIAAVRRGEVNCIVVKDLSRFGRNYKETGNYLDRIFPLLGVRFIAVNDNFDTLTAEQNEYGFVVPLKNLMNEAYSWDISRKVSSALETKERRGEFIGVWAPFGYSKSPQNRHQLIVNPETAKVVREIFSLRLSGLGYQKIARILNDREIVSPSGYLFRSGLTKNEKYQNTIWTAWNIKEICRNPVYLGHLVQGKRIQASYKQAWPERYAPESAWRVVRDAHEALVDGQTFQEVQRLGQARTERYRERLHTNGSVKTDNLFRGLVFCADCGKALSRRQFRNGSGKFYYSFVCVTALNKSSACPRKNLLERELLEVVTDSVRCHLAALTDLEARVRALWESQTVYDKRSLEQQIAAAQRDLIRDQALYDGLYQSMVDGVITQSEYRSMKACYQDRCGRDQTLVEELQQRQQELARTSPENPLFTALWEVRSAEPLSAELVHMLIARIEYGGGSDLHIIFAFQDEFDALSRFLKEAESA